MAKDDVIIYTGYMKKQPEKLSPYIQSIDPVKTTCETHVTLKRTFENSNVRPKRSDVYTSEAFRRTSETFKRTF